MSELTRLEERMRNRRHRRWRRRARILAPLAAIPLLLMTLALSVGIVEYAPQPKKTAPPSRSTDETALVVPTQQSLAARTSMATLTVTQGDLFEGSATAMAELDKRVDRLREAFDALAPTQTQGDDRAER